MTLFGRRRLIVGVLAGALASVALAWILFDPGTTPRGSTTGPTPTPSACSSASPWRWPGARCELRRAPARPAGSARSSTLLGVLALGYLVLSFVHVHDYDLALFHGGYLWLALVTALLIAALAHPAARLGGLLGQAAGASGSACAATASTSGTGRCWR